MAAEVVARILIEGSGLGNNKNVSCRAAISDTPTQMAGPIVRTVDGALSTVVVPSVGIVSGELIALYVKAISGSLYVDPYSTAVTTARSCYLAEGQFNYYTYKSDISVVPSLVMVTAGSQFEYFYAVVT